MKIHNLSKIITLVLIISILLTLVPLSGGHVFAADNAGDEDENEEYEFLVPVNRKNAVPEGYIGIYTAQDLDNMRKDLRLKYILMDDIDLSDWGNWEPLGDKISWQQYSGQNFKYAFTGVFDGNGYVIKNLTIVNNNVSNSRQGFNNALFAYVRGGTIRNVGLVDTHINLASTNGTSIYAAALVSHLWNEDNQLFTIDNCFNLYGHINAENNKGDITAGGLIGDVLSLDKDATISNCYNTASIRAKVTDGVVSQGPVYSASVGGIVGAGGTIHNCYNSGHISSFGTASKSGGIVGSSPKIVKNCFNTGDIVASAMAGGIAGFCTSGGAADITSCYNQGSILLRDISVHSTYSNKAYAGGISGTASTGEYVNLFNTGPVEAEVSNGHVAYLAGLFGRSEPNDLWVAAGEHSFRLENCYNAGPIGSGSGILRSGLIGEHYRKMRGGSSQYLFYNSINNCYYMNNVPSYLLSGAGYFDTINNALAFTETQMQIAENFIGFDFENVWDIDPAINGGYPFLINLPAPDHGPLSPIARVLGLSENEYAVVVRGADGTIIQGADVSIENVGEVKSDEEGIAKFPVSSSVRRKITISAPGYRTVEVIPKVRGGAVYFAVLNLDDGKPYIRSIVMDDYFCLLSNSKKIKEDKNSTTISKIEIKAETKGVSDLRYRLMQKGQTIAENSTGIFNISIGKDFKKDAPIYAYVVGSHGTPRSINYLTRLQVTAGAVDSPSGKKFEIGEKTSFPLPDDWPIIGGENVEFGFDEFPFQIDYDSDAGIIRVALGVDFDKDIYFNDKLRFWSDVKYGYENAVQKRIDDRLDAAHAFGGHPSGFGAGKVKLDAQLLGYGEGRFTSENTFIDVGLYLMVKGEVGYTQYFFLGFVPVYASIKGGAKGELETTLKANFSKDGLESFVFPAFELKVTPYINPSAGVGVQGVLAAEVGGKLNFPLLWRFDEKYFEARADGSIYAKGTAFIFSAKLEKKLYDVKIHDRYWGTGTVSPDSNRGHSKSFSLYDSNQYSLMDRDYLESSSSIMNKENGEVLNILHSNVFPQSQPQLLEAGGKRYLFWLDDGGFHGIDRSDENRTVLMYSIYEDSVWSTPQAVWDDGTGDFYFDAVSDGRNVYVAWTNSNQVLGPGVTLDGMAATTEISTAHLRDGSIVSTATLTDNSYCDLLPVISADGEGNAFVSWFTKEDNQIFDSGSNGIYISSFDGASWSEPSELVREDNRRILSMDCGRIDNNFAVSYITDEDGDNETRDDRAIYLFKRDAAGPRMLNTHLSEVSNPQFAGMSGQEALYWYSDANIHCTTSAENSDIDRIFDDPVADLTDSFSVIADETDTHLLWTRGASNEEGEDITKIFSAKRLNGSWTKGVAVADVGANASKLEGVIADNGYPAFVFAERTPDEHYQINKYEIVPKPDIELIDVSYDKGRVKSNTVLPLNLVVLNKGLESVSTVQLEILRGAAIHTETIPVQLLPGETVEIKVDDFVMPEVTSVSEYVIRVTVDQETNLTDNERTLSLGYTDLDLAVEKYLAGNEWYAGVTIQNRTEIPTGATFRIYGEDADGPVLFEKRMGLIEKGQSLVMIFNLEELTKDRDIGTLFYQVVADKEEFHVLNNSQLLVYEALPIEPVPTFSDVPPDHWAFPHVENLAALGIVSGYGATNEFRPDNKINREEVSKMIAIGADLTVSEGFESEFSDLDQVSPWALEYILALEEAGVISGFGKTNEFRAKNNIKRNHAAKMIVRGFALEAGDIEVNLVDIEGVDCEEYIRVLASNGIVSGYGGSNKFKPDDEISRAEFAKIIDLAMQLSP